MAVMVKTMPTQTTAAVAVAVLVAQVEIWLPVTQAEQAALEQHLALRDHQ
jgi:hypothetical protein